MKIDTPGLEAFLAVSSTNSFHRAAESLNLSTTAISHRIRKLESSLGVILFNRTTREVHLSQAGLDLLSPARAFLADFEAQLALVAGRHRTQNPILSIACMPTIAAYALGPVFTRFRKKYPTAQMRVLDVSATDVALAVAQGNAELGLATLAVSPPSLSSEPLMTESYVFVCPRTHAFAKRTSVTWTEVSNLPLIRMAQTTAYRMIIDEALGIRAERMKWICEVQHTNTALMLVSGGNGFAVLPRPAESLTRAFGLACVRLTRPHPTHTVGLLTRHSGVLSQSANDFRQALREYFAHLSVPR